MAKPADPLRNLALEVTVTSGNLTLTASNISLAATPRVAAEMVAAADAALKLAPDLATIVDFVPAGAPLDVPDDAAGPVSPDETRPGRTRRVGFRATGET